MFPYIDIHTHNVTESDQRHLSIYNASLNQKDNSTYISIAIHPWYIHEDEDQIGQLLKCLENEKNILAIGECGLDFSIDTNRELQLHFFKIQIQLAEKFKKAIIIHCVKAFDDLIRLKLESSSEIAWIIHGFNKSPELASSLVNCGFYLSIGTKLIHNEKLDSLLEKIPLNLLFFETDNDSNHPIEEIYKKASLSLNIGLDELKKQILVNFNKAFNEN